MEAVKLNKVLLNRATCRCSSVIFSCLFLLFVSLPTYGSSELLYEFPLPANVKSQSVAIDIIQHGQRISIATLSNVQSMELLLDFFRDTWNASHGDLPGHIEEQSGDWHIISRIEDGWNHVVQIRESVNGFEAYISVLELKPVEHHTYQPAMPSGGVLVSSTTGNDFGKTAVTDVVFSQSREGEVAGFYRNHFEANEWLLVSDKAVEDSTVMLLQRNGEQAEVVVTQTRDGSVAVINQVFAK